MYSVEKLYLAPLVGSIRCSGPEQVIEFVTFNSFKTNNKYRGHYQVTSADGRTVAHDHFDWKAHCRPTSVLADVPEAAQVCSEATGGCTLTVANKAGDEVTKYFSCQTPDVWELGVRDRG